MAVLSADSYDRSDIVLGLMIRANQDEAIWEAIEEAPLDCIDSQEDQNFRALVRILQWTPGDIKACIASGEAARKLGVSRRVRELIYTPIRSQPSLSIPLYPYIGSDWDLFEHTLPHLERSLHVRYSVFPRYNGLSCAPNTILFAAIYSGAGIRRCDAMTFESWCQQRDLQKVLRLILNQPWGSRGFEYARYATCFESALRQQLNKSNDDMLDINDALQETFLGLPSFTFTTASGYICCREKLLFPESVNAHRRAVVSLRLDTKGTAATKTVEELCNDFFKPAEIKCVTRCAEPRCTAKTRLFFKRLILDRLPPWLVLNVAAGILLNDASRAPFQATLVVEHRTTRRIKVKRYSLYGVIYHVQGNHYIARWQGRGKRHPAYVEYDDRGQNRTVKNVLDWQAHLDKTTTFIRALFYKQQDS